jgi:hypothetical protein
MPLKVFFKTNPLSLELQQLEISIICFRFQNDSILKDGYTSKTFNSDHFRLKKF